MHPTAKRSVLTEGTGVPLAVAPAGANLNDFKLARGTIESIPIKRPEATPEQPQGFCLDKGYDFPEIYDLAAEFGFTRTSAAAARRRRRSSARPATAAHGHLRRHARPRLRG